MAVLLKERLTTSGSKPESKASSVGSSIESDKNFRAGEKIYSIPVPITINTFKNYIYILAILERKFF
jgi:hypothetical protein